MLQVCRGCVCRWLASSRFAVCQLTSVILLGDNARSCLYVLVSGSWLWECVPMCESGWFSIGARLTYYVSVSLWSTPVCRPLPVSAEAEGNYFFSQPLLVVTEKCLIFIKRRFNLRWFIMNNNDVKTFIFPWCDRSHTARAVKTPFLPENIRCIVFTQLFKDRESLLQKSCSCFHPGQKNPTGSTREEPLWTGKRFTSVMLLILNELILLQTKRPLKRL